MAAERRTSSPHWSNPRGGDEGPLQSSTALSSGFGRWETKFSLFFTAASAVGILVSSLLFPPAIVPALLATGLGGASTLYNARKPDYTTALTPTAPRNARRFIDPYDDPYFKKDDPEQERSSRRRRARRPQAEKEGTEKQATRTVPVHEASGGVVPPAPAAAEPSEEIRRVRELQEQLRQQDMQRQQRDAAAAAAAADRQRQQERAAHEAQMAELRRKLATALEAAEVARAQAAEREAARAQAAESLEIIEAEQEALRVTLEEVNKARDKLVDQVGRLALEVQETPELKRQLAEAQVKEEAEAKEREELKEKLRAAQAASEESRRELARLQEAAKEEANAKAAVEKEVRSLKSKLEAEAKEMEALQTQLEKAGRAREDVATAMAEMKAYLEERLRAKEDELATAKRAAKEAVAAAKLEREEAEAKAEEEKQAVEARAKKVAADAEIFSEQLDKELRSFQAEHAELSALRAEGAAAGKGSEEAEARAGRLEKYIDSIGRKLFDTDWNQVNVTFHGKTYNLTDQAEKLEAIMAKIEARQSEIFSHEDAARKAQRESDAARRSAEEALERAREDVAAEIAKRQALEGKLSAKEKELEEHTALAATLAGNSEEEAKRLKSSVQKNAEAAAGAQARVLELKAQLDALLREREGRWSSIKRELATILEGVDVVMQKKISKGVQITNITASSAARDIKIHVMKKFRDVAARYFTSPLKNRICTMLDIVLRDEVAKQIEASSRNRLLKNISTDEGSKLVAEAIKQTVQKSFNEKLDKMQREQTVDRATVSGRSPSRGCADASLSLLWGSQDEAAAGRRKKRRDSQLVGMRKGGNTASAAAFPSEKIVGERARRASVRSVGDAGDIAFSKAQMDSEPSGLLPGAVHARSGESLPDPHAQGPDMYSANLPALKTEKRAREEGRFGSGKGEHDPLRDTLGATATLTRTVGTGSKAITRGFTGPGTPGTSSRYRPQTPGSAKRAPAQKAQTPTRKALEDEQFRSLVQQYVSIHRDTPSYEVVQNLYDASRARPGGMAGNRGRTTAREIPAEVEGICRSFEAKQERSQGLSRSARLKRAVSRIGINKVASASSIASKPLNIKRAWDYPEKGGWFQADVSSSASPAAVTPGGVSVSSPWAVPPLSRGPGKRGR